MDPRSTQLPQADVFDDASPRRTSQESPWHQFESVFRAILCLDLVLDISTASDNEFPAGPVSEGKAAASKTRSKFVLIADHCIF